MVGSERESNGEVQRIDLCVGVKVGESRSILDVDGHGRALHG